MQISPQFIKTQQTQKENYRPVSIISAFCFVFSFFFYQGFLSRTVTAHRIAGEGSETFFIPLYHFHPLKNIQTFMCYFAREMTIIYFQSQLSHIFNPLYSKYSNVVFMIKSTQTLTIHCLKIRWATKIDIALNIH